MLSRFFFELNLKSYQRVSYSCGDSTILIFSFFCGLNGFYHSFLVLLHIFLLVFLLFFAVFQKYHLISSSAYINAFESIFYQQLFPIDDMGLLYEYKEMELHFFFTLKLR